MLEKTETLPAYFAVIDIGSNAIRMIVAKLDESFQLTVQKKFRVFLRLGKEVFASGQVNELMIQKLLTAIERLTLELREYPNCLTYLSATSALRDASNHGDIKERLDQQTGIPLAILSGHEEAQLLYQGLCVLMPMEASAIAFADLGGGSLEISLMQQRQLIFQRSFDYGTLRIVQMLKTLPFQKVEEFLDKMEGEIARELKTASWKTCQLILTGGNAKILARLLAKLSGSYIEENESWIQINFQEILRVFHEIQACPSHQWSEQWAMGDEQVEVFGPALQIFKRLITVLQGENISIPLIGFKEALLVQRVQKAYPDLEFIFIPHFPTPQFLEVE
ncbi:hypothetical protein WDW89_19410 [Deltaproteobacteria bacterium TL4]